MRYGTVCSGIEAPSVAWRSLGWRPAFFSEIEKFPKAVLAHHYPNVPDLGDMTNLEAFDSYAGIDVLIGGTPCQSFSVAGLRKGLADPRGNLALVYLALVDRLRPTWFVWENVPGVLSSSEGRDFGAFIGAVGKLGYGFAYRVLDAFYFGCACPRPRVFVVGHIGGWPSAAAVLFESEAFGYRAEGKADGPRPHTLSSKNAGGMNARGNIINETRGLRRMTPREAERAMGFPDDYTNIAEDCRDGPRYRALGNSMAVPVVRWIGKRIQMVSDLHTEEKSGS